MPIPMQITRDQVLEYLVRKELGENVVEALEAAIGRRPKLEDFDVMWTAIQNLRSSWISIQEWARSVVRP